MSLLKNEGESIPSNVAAFEAVAALPLILPAIVELNVLVPAMVWSPVRLTGLVEYLLSKS